jgi:multicomponent Na+:H+ antiporter subunit D
LAVLLASSLLNAAYFLPIVYRAFMNPPPPATEAGIKEAPIFCLLPICVTALASVALFFFHKPLIQLAQLALGG